jgi:hypothetical protein
MNNSTNILNTNPTVNENDQLFIAIEKYLLLIMLEFQEHLGKYKNLYQNV